MQLLARFISRSRLRNTLTSGLTDKLASEHIATVKPRGDFVSLVLPEVLKNPIAFFKFNKEEKKMSQLQELLLHLNKKPNFSARKLKKKWGTTKPRASIKKFRK